MNLEILTRHKDSNDLAEQAALDISIELQAQLDSKPVVNFVLTGGSVGILALKKLTPHLLGIDLTNLHIWFGDERFVSRTSPERNAMQAQEVFLDLIDIPKENLHFFPALEDGTLLETSEEFAKKLHETNPHFDIVLLGMGPDGHVASLFPGFNATAVGDLIVAEANSPKPPSERISFSYQALNSADQIWFLVSGSDKAAAVASALGADSDLPAAKVSGRIATRWYLDQAAASEIIS
jgi:6-phosphogluconolactonase